jgi:hypothetical protein
MGLRKMKLLGDRNKLTFNGILSLKEIKKLNIN